jgi:hypothetical protein
MSVTCASGMFPRQLLSVAVQEGEAQRVHHFTNAPSPEVSATWLDSVKGQPLVPSPRRLPGVLPPSTILTARPQASRALGRWS